MNFIIPKNYKFKNKILGIIDYPTAFINLLWNVILYFIFKNIFINITIKIFLFSSLSFPVLLFTIFGFNNESPIITLKYIIKFAVKQKVFLFKKEIYSANNMYANNSILNTTSNPRAIL